MPTPSSSSTGRLARRQRPIVPANLTLLPLPPYSPELNPIENLWQFLRHNFLNARIYDGYQAVVDACCDAWNRLRAIPGKVRSITRQRMGKTGQCLGRLVLQGLVW